MGAGGVRAPTRGLGGGQRSCALSPLVPGARRLQAAATKVRGRVFRAGGRRGLVWQAGESGQRPGIARRGAPG